MKTSYKIAMMVPAISLIMSSCVGKFKNEITSLGKDYILLEDIYTHEYRLVFLPYEYSKHDAMPDVLPYLQKGDTIDLCITCVDNPKELYDNNLQFNYGPNTSGFGCYATVNTDTIKQRQIRKQKQTQQKYIRYFNDSLKNQRQR